MMRRLFAAGAAVLMLATGLSMSTASAAQLDVVTGFQKSLVTESACARAMSGNTPVIKTAVGPDRWLGSSSRISVSSVPASCAGRPIEIFVHNAAGTVLASGNATASSSFVVPVNASYPVANVATVVARIDGWIFPTQWATPGPSPAVICQAIDPQGNVSTAHSCAVTSIDSPRRYFWGGERIDYTVAWSGPQPPSNWRWRVTLDLAQSPFNRSDTDSVGTVVGSSQITLPSGYECGQLPQFSFSGSSVAGHSGSLRIQPGWLSLGQTLCRN